MAEPAIRARGLGKRYRFAARRPERSLRVAIEDSVARLLGRHREEEAAPIWALRDLDLEVGRGEFIGIIGRNGSGKSTLLKLISRLTRPTTGRLEIRGKVGSLLEVGVGFNPEFTGRENALLNAAIMGIDAEELARRFDDIVDFSGIGRFIDTPVKRYSSGMTMRLGFAVAAHADADILLLDEVLAVGDAAFQERCLNKVRAIRREGRTVLYVSHGLEPIREHCDRVLWLDSGRALAFDEPAAVVDAYEARELGPAVVPQVEVKSAGEEPVEPESWPGLDAAGRQAREALAASFLGAPERLVQLGPEALFADGQTAGLDRAEEEEPGFALAWTEAGLGGVGVGALISEAARTLRCLARAGHLAIEGPQRWPALRELWGMIEAELAPRVLFDGVLDLGSSQRGGLPAAQRARLRRRLIVASLASGELEDGLEERIAEALFGSAEAARMGVQALDRRRSLVLARAEAGCEEARLVLRGDGALRFESAPQAWSHAVTLPMGEGSGPGVLRLRARVDAGLLGLAGLGLDGSRVIGERFLFARSGVEQRLEVFLPELAEAPRALLRCGELEGQSTRGLVFALELLRPGSPAVLNE